MDHFNINFDRLEDKFVIYGIQNFPPQQKQSRSIRNAILRYYSYFKISNYPRNLLTRSTTFSHQYTNTLLCVEWQTLHVMFQNVRSGMYPYFVHQDFDFTMRYLSIRYVEIVDRCKITYSIKKIYILLGFFLFLRSLTTRLSFEDMVLTRTVRFFGGFWTRTVRPRTSAVTKTAKRWHDDIRTVDVVHIRSRRQVVSTSRRPVRNDRWWFVVVTDRRDGTFKCAKVIQNTARTTTADRCRFTSPQRSEYEPTHGCETVVRLENDVSLENTGSHVTSRGKRDPVGFGFLWTS